MHTSIEILLNSSNITFSPDQSFELDTSVYCLRNFQNLKFYFSSNFNAVFQTMIICRVVIGSLRSLYYLNKWVFKMNTYSFLFECFNFSLTLTEKNWDSITLSVLIPHNPSFPLTHTPNSPLLLPQTLPPHSL